MSKDDQPPLLTDKEKEAIWRKAEAKIMAEQKEKASAALQVEYEAMLRKNLIPEEQTEPMLIDLAGHADRITLDGTVYLHGHTYYFTERQRAVVADIMAQTWRHEHDIKNANSDFYRSPRNMAISSRDMGRSASAMLRM
jgi:hypothetical protein